MPQPVSANLKLLPRGSYPATSATGDPLKLYYAPVFGRMYRRRVELCLAQLTGGERILEVGYGSGVTFLNLAESYKEIHGIDLGAQTNELIETYKPHGIHPTLQNASVLEIPYPDAHFDAVLLISILEHLKPEQQLSACREIHRVLKPRGQLVYGVPIERPFMVFMFRLLGYNIREPHFSTEQDVSKAATEVFSPGKVTKMTSTPAIFGAVYEVGSFTKIH